MQFHVTEVPLLQLGAQNGASSFPAEDSEPLSG